MFQAHVVMEVLSSLDGQQVEEQLKVADRRLGDVDRRLHRKLHLLQTTHQGSDSAAADIAHIREWMAEKSSIIRDKDPLGFRAKDAETKLLQIKVSASFTLQLLIVYTNKFFFSSNVAHVGALQGNRNATTSDRELGTENFKYTVRS